MTTFLGQGKDTGVPLRGDTYSSGDTPPVPDLSTGRPIGPVKVRDTG